MNVIDAFMRWWNDLALENGKLKFRTQREAAEFVRRVQNQNGGPNAKIIAMRNKYNAVNRDRDQQNAGSNDDRNAPVFE